MTTIPARYGQADDDLLERVRTSLAATNQSVTPGRVAAALRAEGAVLGDAAVLEVTEALRAEITGAGVLEPLLRTPGVTDVLVNGPRDVWIDRGGGLERSTVRFRDEHAVRQLAQRLASTAGRRLDDAVPFVDARLPDGVRLHAVLPPVAPRGTLISLRVPASTSFGLDELVDLGSVQPAIAPWLRAIVHARLAFLVTGSTGSGKTTVLSALLGLVAPGERIVLVEDSSELHPAHPHVVRLECRSANVEGSGHVDLDDLLRQSLRMRPDRIVVGEARGSEMITMLAALNTGHEGGCGTLHANSADDVPARLEALGIAAGLPRAAVHAQAGAALDVLIHLGRDRGGLRHVAEIDLLDRTSDGWVQTERAFTVTASGELTHGTGYGRLARLLERRGVDP
ncbi:TadA family conjugal transfer-associated ATPase [Actinobacteria bacterium YIM 96077]|uniref:Pilus assembly protein CpaF n=1 Tax=Phytoactinopolyspora halophila TaxID=1981511 RepID=A0A329QZR6_9ACTN|nr:TadA family conjugal transfer-associated ATPase [Phytoactinopolyspora halophila]AYY11749.1 TadA family conjugal transfer-associated ATPase [Actinobacteria bacterium YIM 96077]RAW17815.1 pilus assembly protein CpaF [Phytoactinopolyspora halophila]